MKVRHIFSLIGRPLSRCRIGRQWITGRAVGAIFLSLSVVSLSARVLADDPARGRLPDGRAFRTDSDGVQLVDYIAELEVNIEALNRRVSGLEGEVTEKQHQIERLAAGQGNVVGAISERDLGAGSSRSFQQRVENKACPVCAEPVRCPEERTRPIPETCSCAGEVQQTTARLERQIADLKIDLGAEQRAHQEEIQGYESRLAAVQQRLGAAPQHDCSSEVAKVTYEVNQARTQLERARAELVEARAARELALSQSQEENSGARREAAKLAQSLVALQEELREVQGQRSTAEASLSKFESERSALVALREKDKVELERLRTDLTKSQEALSEAQGKVLRVAMNSPTAPSSAQMPPRGALPSTGESRAMLRGANELRDTTEDAGPQRGTLLAARERAVDALRGSINGELTRLTALVSERDRVLAQYRSAPRPVQIRPAETTSSRGRDLRALSAATREASSVYELSLLQRDIREIRTKLQDDLSLMNRMMRATPGR